MRVKKKENKYKEGRGKGAGADYKPWIKTREFNSRGTCSNVIDPKSGRTMQLLSQAEEKVFYVLRWDDDVADIREQYPLDVQLTTAIAKQLGIKPSYNGLEPMTTDFLVTKKNGWLAAYSVKNSRADMDARHIELSRIENEYWSYLKVEFSMVFAEDIDPHFVRNIEDVFQYYDERFVFDEISHLKHLIAHKRIAVNDMEHKQIDYQKIKQTQAETIKNSLTNPLFEERKALCRHIVRNIINAAKYSRLSCNEVMAEAAVKKVIYNEENYGKDETSLSQLAFDELQKLASRPGRKKKKSGEITLKSIMPQSNSYKTE